MNGSKRHDKFQFFPYADQQSSTLAKPAMRSQAFVGGSKPCDFGPRDFHHFLHGKSIWEKRPIKLPDITGIEGARLVMEFADLARHLERLSLNGGLLADISAKTGLDLTELTKHFNAILLNRVDENYPGRPHCHDPTITSPVIMYATDEIEHSVQRAIEVKIKKGPAYATGVILVLHTLPEPGKPHFPSLGMRADELAKLASDIVTAPPISAMKFREVWLLGDCTIDGNRLWQVRGPDSAG